MQEELKSGTTIFATVFADGVVMACDTRMSIGQYVQNRACDKIARLYDNVYICRSGSAADCQIVTDLVHSYVEQHAILSGEHPDVKLVAHLVKQIIYRNKHLIAATIVAGWDEKNGGQVYGVPIGGTLVPEKWTVEGSGSSFVWGVCDAEFKEDMTLEEAQNMATTVISLAIARDPSSGGIIRLLTITSAGAERKLIRDVPLYAEEIPPPAVDVDMVDA